MDNDRRAEIAALDPLVAFGPAQRPGRPVAKDRPAGMDDATVEALGKLSEALEIVEHARGLLYAFHRHCGMADLTLQDAIKQLRDAGQRQTADELEQVLVGRDIIKDHWSFQVIEDYDANYWEVFRAMERRARLVADSAPNHLFEAEMQYDEQTPGES